MDLLYKLKSKSLVELKIHRVATFEIADSVFYIGLHNHIVRARSGSSNPSIRLKTPTHLPSGVLNQCFGVSPTPGCSLGADIHEIIRVIVMLAKNFRLCMMQQGNEFIEESFSTFFR